MSFLHYQILGWVLSPQVLTFIYLSISGQTVSNLNIQSFSLCSCIVFSLVYYTGESSATKNFSHNRGSPFLSCFQNTTSKERQNKKQKGKALPYVVEEAGSPALAALRANPYSLLQEETKWWCREDFPWIDWNLLPKKKCLFIFPAFCRCINLVLYSKDLTEVFASIW